jgi:hypothetical protein
LQQLIGVARFVLCRRTARFMLWPSLKRMFFGLLMLVIGMFMATHNNAFIATSTPAKLIVMQIDSRRNRDNTVIYTPVFGLVTDKRPRPTYKGGLSASFSFHRTGDIVPGRYDAATGMMKSDVITEFTRWFARFLQLMGVIAFVQGVLIRLGRAEMPLPFPLRDRMGSRFTLWR